MKILKALLFSTIVFIALLFIGANVKDSETSVISIPEPIEIPDVDSQYIEINGPAGKKVISGVEEVVLIYEFVNNMIWEISDDLETDFTITFKSNKDSSYSKSYNVMTDNGVLNLFDTNNEIKATLSAEESQMILDILGI